MKRLSAASSDIQERDDVLQTHLRMRERFLHSLEGKASLTLLTLGPEETSSYKASMYLIDYLRTNGVTNEMRIHAPNNFDEVLRSFKAGVGNFMVMPNAYENITEVYWDPTMETVFSYYHNTPAYGLAVENRAVLDARRIRVSSCPAVYSLIDELGSDLLAGKEVQIVTTASTVSAAETASLGLAEIAVTNATSAAKYGLSFLAEVPGVDMLWSVFARREK